MMRADNNPDAIRLVDQGVDENINHLPNHLIAKIPNPEALRGRPDPVIIMRLEAAIAKERKAYLGEMSKDVQRLIDALGKHVRPSELWPIAHELRCMAGTFAYPFLTQVAQVLCAFIKKHQTATSLPPDVAHVFANALQRARHHKGPIQAKEEAVIVGLRKIVAQHLAGSS
ncbi:MAG: hypothetical protein WAW96_08020 [Alphaproteobacteria bacterium]